MLPQKGVLGCLLADRRSAANFPAAHIANEGVFNGVRIEPVMAAKSTVLRYNGGAGHVRIDLVQRHPILGNAVSVQDHGCRDWRRHEAVPQHPKHREANAIAKDLAGEKATPARARTV